MAPSHTGFDSFFLISTLIAFSFLPYSLASASIRTSASKLRAQTIIKETEFIRSKCNSTEYPHLCVTSLSSYAPLINKNPIHLADVALSVCLKSAQFTSAMMAKNSSSSSSSSSTRHKSSREAKVMSDCLESMKDSVEYLWDSLKEMGRVRQAMDKKVLKGEEVLERMNDIQTWVSTALTDEGTCMDGFATNERHSAVKGEVRGSVVRLAQLTSNALALVNSLVST